MVKLEHAVRFLQLLGGDVNGDFYGVPASQLAASPGIAHLFGLARTALLQDVVITFLDAPPSFGMEGPVIGRSYLRAIPCCPLRTERSCVLDRL
ncbi:hypothetical protein [Arthrobacter sp. StoSoilB13]|uniref:hypothetical protein n=1 Tax=Arthrobacter sp. StoSoilB13 TaxID=2830993 RepID=UPI001CC36266|nr:hypothetical protein [Arthrobacter sp. StoSoilB13]